MPIDLNISNTQNSPSSPNSVEGESIQNALQNALQNVLSASERILTTTGQPLEMYDSYDSIPQDIRPQFVALSEALSSSRLDPAIVDEVREGMHSLLTDTGNIEDKLAYLQYLYSIVTQPEPRIILCKPDAQTKANMPDRRSKLFAPIGIEFAYHPPIKSVKFESNSNFNLGGLSGLVATSGSIECSIGYDSETEYVTQNQLSELQSQYQSYDPEPGDDVPCPCEPSEPMCNCGADESCSACDVVPVTEAIGRSRSTGALQLRRSRQNPETGVVEREPWNNRTDDDRDDRVTSRSRSRLCKDSYYYTRKLEELLSDAGLMKGFGTKVYKDSGDTVEVCSPIHKSWKSMRDWFSVTDRIAKSFGYRPWRRSVGGGGMHINISYNKTVPNWKLAYVNFFMMVANYPQLNWIFNEPGDDHTANALALNDRFIEAYHKMVTDGMVVSDQAWRDMTVCGGKGRAINCKDEHHFELRTFEMVRSPQELHDVIMLINSLLGFCMAVAEWGILIPLELEIPTLYMDEAEERGYWLPNGDNTTKFVFADLMWSGEGKFNELVRALDLDPKIYRKYIRRNYHTRRAHPYGKKFFV